MSKKPLYILLSLASLMLLTACPRNPNTFTTYKLLGLEIERYNPKDPYTRNVLNNTISKSDSLVIKLNPDVKKTKVEELSFNLNLSQKVLASQPTEDYATYQYGVEKVEFISLNDFSNTHKAHSDIKDLFLPLYAYNNDTLTETHIKQEINSLDRSYISFNGYLTYKLIKKPTLNKELDLEIRLYMENGEIIKNRKSFYFK